MRNKIDYAKLVNEHKKTFKDIHDIALTISKFELDDNVRVELDEIITLSNIEKDSYNLKNDAKSFSNIVNSCCQIDDDCSEILMVTGDLIEDVNNLPEEVRQGFYEHMGIKPIDQSDQGISDELRKQIIRIQAYANGVFDGSMKYFPDEEDGDPDVPFIYEDEVKEE